MLQRPRLPKFFVRLFLVSVLTVTATVALVRSTPEGALAIAPCIAHSATAEEAVFIGLLQSWRDNKITGSLPLAQSAPLNAAAMGYAQFLANSPGASGHYADGATGYPWATRAIQCGYPANQAAGGEGLAAVQSSQVVSVSAQQALNTMTAENGGGVWVPSNVGLPVKCVGVGRATSTDGKKVAWVTLIFAASGACPSVVSAGSATPTPSLSGTPSPTKTPTPSPTPNPVGVTVAIHPGWNLVVLPPGPVTDVLHRAQGCYRTVYQQQDGQWLRYSPEVPPYANNLKTLNGGTYWVEGTAENCGVVQL